MSELTDRLRTCVAHLTTIEVSIILTDDQMEAIIDARKLLVEAADELEKPIEVRLGEPMEIVQAVPPPQVARYSTPFNPPLVVPEPGSVWYDDGNTSLPTQPVSKNACPKCDSRANKTVRASKDGIMLECPVCGHIWKR